MPDTVVDASVVAALCFGEARGPEAAALLRGAALFAPDLLTYELANIAKSKALRDPQRHLEIKEGLSTALGLKITLLSVDAEDIFTVAMADSLSAYDSQLPVRRTEIGRSSRDL